ncbi:hypothetical protein COT99_00625 [Candidatus Falkowbacteria bacterium CG10_big_fil_rev_8_21_14_0_10_43_10]|uniref:DUF5666 domain-containing protein n=1 Tax=Candidatus Falkowbacteria bacterium CG10_big_fil_rev_8_21_14_0_10_43_10 TaxID=1974567 RepID=A0A2H0V2Z4_9BACT|nr:MAG: hypothetical protein COT99_00625 [Candidatus Falkowbacteria bacterium CG10_big_fil_rev_8_21_14_0_10_43_10]
MDKRKTKKYFLAAFLLLLLFLVAGCANNSQGVSSRQKDSGEDETQSQGDGDRQDRFNENFIEASLADLAIGQRVMVMGTANSDNSISANRVIIGDSSIDWQNFSQPMAPPIQEDDGSGRPATSQPTSNFSGQRPDMENFQNMSEEERAKLREEMATRRGTAGAARPNRGGAGMARINGEIISRDEATITLKLAEGGSKLIFLSESTAVMKIKE